MYMQYKHAHYLVFKDAGLQKEICCTAVIKWQDKMSNAKTSTLIVLSKEALANWLLSFGLMTICMT